MLFGIFPAEFDASPGDGCRDAACRVSRHIQSAPVLLVLRCWAFSPPPEFLQRCYSKKRVPHESR
jgi:hypothetical protein